MLSSAPTRRKEAMKIQGQFLIRCLAAAALAGALSTAALPCAAQAYPAKPLLVLMPLQAGSAVDVVIRILAQKMGGDMGQQVVIRKQPGAAGSIGGQGGERG